MSFFGSVWRFISSLFGIAEGRTQIATDRLLVSSPDTIRAEFRKTRDDWTRDYHEMRNALAELMRIRAMRQNEIQQLNKGLGEIDAKMAGAIELYKRHKDERYRDSYGGFGAKKEQTATRITELNTEITAQDKAIEQYKGRLQELQSEIEQLNKEESETVADIISSSKMKELNDRLSGMSHDTQSKNLNAIREARQKAKSTAKLSGELSGLDQSDIDKKLIQAGTGSKYLSEFDSALALDNSKVFATEAKPVILEKPAPTKDEIIKAKVFKNLGVSEVDDLFN